MALVALFLLGDGARASSRPLTEEPIQGLPVAGPALAGDAVVWGERYRDGSSAVIQQRPPAGPQVVQRIAAPRGARRKRGFAATSGRLTASTGWIAYGQEDATSRSIGDDVVVNVGSTRALAARTGAPFRNALPGCQYGRVGMDAEDDRLVIGQSVATCGEVNASRVWLLEGRSAPRLLFTTPKYTAIGQVRVAGPLVAWTERSFGGLQDRLTVMSTATGGVLAVLRPRDFAGARSFDDFDIDAAGNVVVLARRLKRCSYVCVIWLRLDDRRPRTISRSASGQLATAAGRVVYVAVRGGRPDRLVLASFDGSAPRTLDRFTGSRELIGDLAMSGDTVAWGVLSAPGEPGTAYLGSIERAFL